MPYRLRINRSLEHNLRNIAVEQVESAMGEIRDPELDRHETVHQLRKRCKKIRALIRLVRPAFDAYPLENRFFRDAAARLSFVRDSQSTIECFDALLESCETTVDREAMSAVRSRLVQRRQRVADDTVGIDREIETFLDQLHDSRNRIDRWQIEDDGWNAIKGGLKQTYGRGRNAFGKARRKPTVENFHEWRKRTKYHGLHAQLLRDIWPAMMKLWATSFGNLAERLGDEHDLALFQELLDQEQEQLGDASELKLLKRLAKQKRKVLQAQALKLGDSLYAERPSAVARRFGAYWNASAESPG